MIGVLIFTIIVIVLVSVLINVLGKFTVTATEEGEGIRVTGTGGHT